ncbi:DUF3168 domain-containing protein [Mesorhizobium sp. NBSH29]|uniref:DUF3168 domain-containing protein n=1 Tax=Mesorhizobium sp. NBSH29 TaxID=2654249 RepID=UPI0018966C83|nr:DUF3168 domain-containing protein [Mesorhizobium sp. NBSH29]QPC87215.1 DUF3168 domain-containing protein [Mesorhizobium sp. NBSH29]
MTSPAVELQKAIFATLSGDGALAALVGGRIFDHAPASVAFPYITFGRTSVYDWSTASEGGSEQVFTLHVWSRAKGKLEVLSIMDRIRTKLDNAALVLAGHHLVNLRNEYSEARHVDDLSLHQGLLRFRAVTEPAA